jgi:hypothetical protein
MKLFENRILHKWELHDPYSSPSSLRIFQSRRPNELNLWLGWIHEKTAYRIMTSKWPLGKERMNDTEVELKRNML